MCNLKIYIFYVFLACVGLRNDCKICCPISAEVTCKTVFCHKGAVLFKMTFNNLLSFTVNPKYLDHFTTLDYKSSVILNFS